MITGSCSQRSSSMGRRHKENWNVSTCTTEELWGWWNVSLRKQPTFGDATTGFPTKWCLRNERRNSIPVTRHYPDLDSASDWLNQISHAARPIRSTAQIWVVTRHQYGISALVSQTSFRGETSGSVAKCRLFSQTNKMLIPKLVFSHMYFWPTR